MNYKPLAALLLATALTGCNNLCPTPPPVTTAEASSVSSTAPSATAAIPKATSNKALMDGWEVAVTGVKSLGQIYKTDTGSEYEAAESWTAVSIAITNKTGKRQRDDNAPITGFASIVDSSGNKYELSEKDWPNLTDKPFAPGETRLTILLFDAPKNVKPVQLMLDEGDEKYPILKLR